MRVDVLVSGMPPGSIRRRQGTVTKTILQNIQVLSAGTDIQKDAEGKPQQVQVVNLLVSPEQAQTLSLASNRIEDSTGAAQSAGYKDRARFRTTQWARCLEMPRSAARPARSRRAAPKVFTIEVINGNKIQRRKIQISRGKAVRAKAGHLPSHVSARCVSFSPPGRVCGHRLRRRSQAGGASFQDSSNELSVAVGKTVLVDCVRPVTRVAIGLGDVAEATAISPNEIMVNGKTAGETSLIIWDDRGGRQFFNVTVRASTAALDNNMEAVRRELRTELPGQTLKVTSENGVIYLRGTVKDLNSSTRAVADRIHGRQGCQPSQRRVCRSPSRRSCSRCALPAWTAARPKSLGINLFNLGLGNTIGGISTGQFSPPFVGGGHQVPRADVFCRWRVRQLISNEGNLFAFFPGLNAGAYYSGA